MDSFYGLQLYHFLALPRAALCLYPLLALHRAALSVIRAAPCGSICLSLDLFNIRTRCAEQRDLLHYNYPVSPDHHYFVGCGKYCGNYHMVKSLGMNCRRTAECGAGHVGLPHGGTRRGGASPSMALSAVAISDKVRESEGDKRKSY